MFDLITILIYFLASIPPINFCTCELSAIVPLVIIIRTGIPYASIAIWTFVLSPLLFATCPDSHQQLRQHELVRKIQITALINCLLSLALRPNEPCLPGRDEVQVTLTFCSIYHAVCNLLLFYSLFSFSFYIILQQLTTLSNQI